MDLTQANKIMEYLRYDEASGDFYWIKTPSTRPQAGCLAGQAHKAGNTSYREIRFMGELYKAHRLAWLYVHGKFPDGHIDHIDGNGLNNRISNLRDVSGSVNQRNKRKLKNNTSGHTGVCLHKGRWIARLKVEGNQISLGSFNTKFAAVYARHAGNIKYGFTERHGQ